MSVANPTKTPLLFPFYCGASGAADATGTAGIAGASAAGATGASGATGSSGAAGASGSAGAAGAAGAAMGAAGFFFFEIGSALRKLSGPIGPDRLSYRGPVLLAEKHSAETPLLSGGYYSAKSMNIPQQQDPHYRGSS